ncbi:GNAT family N-acetyltransferase [Gammaproteobacteria bacterium]|jgi:GNAT superfamily N-acetyltransferase|nr:GNAT family N-acetyltransferase [Gammaproteobacteria bacterium]
MTIQLATSDEDLLALAPVMLQLRPEYSRETLIKQIRKQQADGYQVAMLEMDGDIACVAGFVITDKLAWGKLLYVDDLITSESVRSRGAGKAMMDWLKRYARDESCRELHLDSGVQRQDAHRFYDREGFDRSCLHFAITDLSE